MCPDGKHHPADHEGNAPPGITISVSVPADDTSLYRYDATDDVLRLLIDNPFAEFGIRELARITDYSPKAIRSAVDVLSANDLVHERPEGNRKPVRINRARVNKPEDPVLRIPQPEFHEPVRVALDRLQGELDDVNGVILFGSVARGEADRRSDVDLWVLVQSDRATNQRRANEIAKELGQRRFEGNRYEFQIMVESARSALAQTDDVAEIVTTGVTLHSTDTLQRFKQEVLADG